MATTAWNTLAEDVEKLLAQEVIQLHEQGETFSSIINQLRKRMKEYNFSTKYLPRRVHRTLSLHLNSYYDHHH